MAGISASRTGKQVLRKKGSEKRETKRDASARRTTSSASEPLPRPPLLPCCLYLTILDLIISKRSRLELWNLEGSQLWLWGVRRHRELLNELRLQIRRMSLVPCNLWNVLHESDKWLKSARSSCDGQHRLQPKRLQASSSCPVFQTLTTNTSENLHAGLLPWVPLRKQRSTGQFAKTFDVGTGHRLRQT